jgi:hypothetical protein
MSAAILIERLDRPRQTRPDAWSAGCPCCKSKNGRPISVRELDDGRVLLHAFCGCETESVLKALGLTLGDLFPEPLPGEGPARSYHDSHSQRMSARDLLAVVSEEVTVAALLAADLMATGSITSKAWVRLAQAASRIGRARDHIHG